MKLTIPVDAHPASQVVLLLDLCVDSQLNFQLKYDVDTCIGRLMTQDGE